LSLILSLIIKHNSVPTALDAFVVKNAPKHVEWSAEGLQEHIMRFIAETDQVSLHLHLSLHALINST
jgi:hypothetical protein